MTERGRREPDNKPKVDRLELSKETVRDLTEAEAQDAVGGRIPSAGSCQCPATAECSRNPPHGASCESCVTCRWGPDGRCIGQPKLPKL
jgi:hypothetical protein